ncbi:MAG: TadE/TadG family type IV pilus assembly protein, partial [Pseudomonadota bacterium]
MTKPDAPQSAACAGPRAGRRRLRAFRRARDGAVTVEFVVLAPLLLALAVVAVEFGRVILFQQTMAHSLRGGAQYLSRVPLEVLRDDLLGEEACATGPLGRAVNVVLAGDPLDGVTPTIHPWWTDRAAIRCRLRLIESDTVETRRELWVVELSARQQVDLTLLNVAT